MRRSARFWLKELVYECCWLASGRKHAGAVILLYHSIGGPARLSVPTALFERQVEYLARHFSVLPMRDLQARLSDAARPARMAAITFDDGLLDNYTNALPILQKHGFHASFFVATGTIGQRHQASYGEEPCMSGHQIQELNNLGHEIGAHSVTHPRLSKVPVAQAKVEIEQSRGALEHLLGQAVDSFAYPKGDYNAAVRGLVADAGFACAATIQETPVFPPVDRFALPRVWINPTMGDVQFKAKLSPAVRLYHAMRGRNL